MRTIVQGLFVGIILLLVGNTANAQYREWGRDICDRVRGDLDRAERDLHYLPGEEMRHFNHVRDRVGEFQRRWEHGRFDRGLLDDAIGSLQGLVDRARLHPRDRDILADDARRLRELRERWEHRR